MSRQESNSLQTVQSFLQQLPDLEPDPALWVRVQLLRRQRMGRRRWKRAGWLAGAATAAAMAVVVIRPAFDRTDAKVDDLTSWQQRSQVLEQKWLAQARSALDAQVRVELRLIDVELQTAYDRGADAAELIPLWKQRNEALQELIRSDDSHVRSVTRI